MELCDFSICYFFFSSRRRHTRYIGDWSSDVCSSDLFTPYPMYASPSLWLTDYMIAATLEAAYQERMAARAAAAGSIYQDAGQTAPMSPEVKQAIADEVRRQIELERAAGQSANASGGMD